MCIEIIRNNFTLSGKTVSIRKISVGIILLLATLPSIVKRSRGAVGASKVQRSCNALYRAANVSAVAHHSHTMNNFSYVRTQHYAPRFRDNRHCGGARKCSASFATVKCTYTHMYMAFLRRLFTRVIFIYYTEHLGKIFQRQFLEIELWLRL